VFVRVGTAADVADGQMRVYELDGTAVTVANSEGRLYAFDDTCTHMGCSLANGRLDGTTVTCACHGSQFDVTTGSVLRGPAQRPVRYHEVRIDSDGMLVQA
jgi:3-phenylpropionate/trans-cinnamate dioxygenase ferredoxin component